MKKEINYSNFLIHMVLLIGVVIMLIPFVWMVLTSFKTNNEAISVTPFVLFPSKWKWDAFIEVWNAFDFPRLYMNTIMLIAGRVAFAVVTAAMAGYAFARLNFRGKNICFSLVLFQMMIPSQIFLIPQFVMVSRLGILNTLFALIFPGMVTAFGTFLLRQAYMALPKDLEEAARLDGCNIGQTFLWVMMPLTRSGMIALGIFTSLFAYKDLMWPLIVNTKQTVMPLSAALAKLKGQFSTDFPQLMAASLLACIPMIIIYVVFQKHFIEGIASSGSKL